MLTRGNRTDLNLPSLPDALNEAEHIALAIEHVQQQQEPTMAAVAPVAAAETFKTNPFVGDFNPGTEAGRKIFIKKTRGLDEDSRLDLSKSKSLEIQQYLRGREEHLGKSICNIPIEFNVDGSVKSTANLLTQSHMIKLLIFSEQLTQHSAQHSPPMIRSPSHHFSFVKSIQQPQILTRKRSTNVLMSMLSQGFSRTDSVQLDGTI